MLFNSFEYLIFLPTIFILFVICPKKIRWLLLLLASYTFYISWNPIYIVLLFISTLTDYISSKTIYNSSNNIKKYCFLFFSISINIGLLAFFKYYNFIIYNINFLISKLNINYNIPESNIIIPLGISFYTFQTLSYTLDVFLTKKKPENNLGYFALYVSFFPQLIAGPIERAQNLLPQLKNNLKLNSNNIIQGLKIMSWGFFKKLVIADRLDMFIGLVYSDVTRITTPLYSIATIFFTFQLYCDFSAYSDIAIGSAKLFNINLMKNFNRPFASKSITELWRRWHISLSTWLRDYVYTIFAINLRKLGKLGILIAIFLTFFLSGLWHGASWKFVIMGLMHGFYIIFEYLFWKIICLSKSLKNILSTKYFYPLRIIYTNVLFMLSLIFFRANTTKDALYIIQNLTKDLKSLLIPSYAKSLYNYFVFSQYHFSIAILGIILILILQFFPFKNLKHWFYKQNIIIRFSFYYIYIMSIVIFGIFSGNTFIYFNF